MVPGVEVPGIYITGHTGSTGDWLWEEQGFQVSDIKV